MTNINTTTTTTTRRTADYASIYASPSPSTANFSSAELNHSSKDEADQADQAVQCMEVQEAILANGFDDVTAWISVKMVFILIYAILFTLGIVGNGGVVTAVARNKRLQSARNIFLLNLMITDLLLCLTAIPVTPWYGLMKSWQFGAVMCRLMPLSNSCSVFVTSWSLTAIAVDKFVHITDSTRAPIRLKEAGLITATIWIVCSLINIPYLLSYELVDGSYYVAANQTPYCGQFCDELNWDSVNHRRGYGTTVMLLQFVVPMALITYCYSRILAKVGRDMIVQNRQFSSSLTDKQRLEAVQRKRKVNYILIAMVATFIAAWFPLTLVNILRDFQKEPSFMRAQPYLWPLIAHCIAMSTVVWNPLLFFWLTRKQKAPKMARMLASNTVEVFNSFANRLSRSQTYLSHQQHPKDKRTNSQISRSTNRTVISDNRMGATRTRSECHGNLNPVQLRNGNSSRRGQTGQNMALRCHSYIENHPLLTVQDASSKTQLNNGHAMIIEKEPDRPLLVDILPPANVNSNNSWYISYKRNNSDQFKKGSLLIEDNKGNCSVRRPLTLLLNERVKSGHPGHFRAHSGQRSSSLINKGRVVADTRSSDINSDSD